jgi:hypothetical protein
MPNSTFRFVDPHALPSLAAPTRSLSPRPCVSPGRGPQPQMQPLHHKRIAQLMYERVTSDPQHQLAKHKADSQQATVSPRAASFGATSGHRPNFLVCYLCGQQFSKSSLKIHQPQCYVKQLIAWERGGGTGARGPKPVHPDEWHEALVSSGRRIDGTTNLIEDTRPGSDPSRNLQSRGVEAFNAQQMQQFNTVGMSVCEHCGRTFLPDRLVVHQRSCKPGHTAKPVRKMMAPSQRSTVKPLPRPEGSPKVDTSKSNSDSRTEGSRSCSQEDDLAASRGEKDSDSQASTFSQMDDAEAAAQTIDGGTHPTRSADSAQDSEKQVHLLTTCRGSSSGQSTSPKIGPKLHVVPQPATAALKVEDAVPQLARCKYCNRTFAPDRLGRHENACIERAHSLPRAGSGSNPNSRGPSSSKVNRASAQQTTTGLNTSFGTRPNTSEGAAERRSRTSPSLAHAADEALRSPLMGLREGRVSTISECSFDDRHEQQSTPPPGPHHPRFCTECGSKLAYATQKFCGECGTKILR